MGSNLAKAFLVVTVCLFTTPQGALAQSAPTCPTQSALTRKIERQDAKVSKAQDTLQGYDDATDRGRLSRESRAADFQARRQTYIENYQENCYLGGFLGGQDIGKCISKNKSLADKMKFQRDRVLSLLASYMTKRASGRTSRVAKVDREILRRNGLIELFNTCYPVGGP